MPTVSITGMGCISACGVGVEAFWKAVRGGISAVGPTIFPRWFNHKVRISAQIKPDVLESLPDREQIAKFDLFAQFGLIAAREAVAQSGLRSDEVAGPRTAVIIGSGVGGQWTQEESLLSLYLDPQPTRMDPMTIPRIMMSAVASHISMAYGVTGPTFVVSSACASAAQAIGVGATMVRSGLVDRAIVGGTDAAIAPGISRAWETMRVLSPDACRPFSRSRNGMVLGEGAGVIIVESTEVARARGATIIADFLGYGTSSDANDILRCDPVGASAAMKAALADARIDPRDVNYVNAHGTGTLLNDISETEALRIAFGADADHLAISSTKPTHGHALGATGALELIASVMSIRDQCAPPTLNWLGRDPKCDLDIVANEARPMNIDIALSNSFAFGGINACLLVGKP
jgi:nodulation protein E